MRAHHLKKIGENWHYQRRRPRAFEDVEPRTLIRFSLKTRDFNEARVKAAQISLDLDRKWQDAKQRGISLTSQNEAERYSAAVETTNLRGLPYTQSSDLTNDELLTRLRLLLLTEPPAEEQKAILGLVKEPSLTLNQAFDRFWEHIQDERLSLGKEQQRVKKNVFLRAIRKFTDVVGDVAAYDISREQVMKFREWCIKEVKSGNVNPQSLNKEIGALRRVIATNFEIDGIEKVNPFQRVKLKDTGQQQREPFTSEFICSQIIADGKLDGLASELSILVRLLVNTGARPSELIGLEIEDLNVSTEIPYLHIRKNKTRSLKTEHSERQIPLAGVSLIAGKEYVANGGWGMFVSIPPKLSVSDFMRKVKGRSSFLIQKEFPQLKKRYWGQRLWGRGYFSTTNGIITEDIVLQYLENHINPTDVSR